MKISLITSRLLLGASLGAAALHAADSQTPPQTTQPPSPLIINHYDISLRTEARIDENNYFSYVVDEAKKPTGEWVLEANGETYVEFKVDPSNVFDILEDEKINGRHHIKHLSANVQDSIYIEDGFGSTLNPLRRNTWGFDIKAKSVIVSSGQIEYTNENGQITTEQTMGALSVSQASNITGNLVVYGEKPFDINNIENEYFPFLLNEYFPFLFIDNSSKANGHYNGYLKINGDFQLENAGLALINSGSRDSLLDISGRALITDSLIGVDANDLSKANLTNHTILTANQGVYVGRWEDTNGNKLVDANEVVSTNDRTEIRGVLYVDLIDLLQESQTFKDQNLDLYRGAFFGSAYLENLTNYEYKIVGNKLLISGGLDASKLTASNMLDLEIAIRESLVGGSTQPEGYTGLLGYLQTDLKNDTTSYLGIFADEAKKQEFESFLANAIAEIKTQIKELEDKKRQISGSGESNADTNQGWLDVALGNTHTTEDKTYLAGVLDKITAQDSVINEDFVSLKVETKKLSDIMTSINATGDTQAAKEDAKKTFEVILGSSKGEYVSQSIAQMTNATFFRDLTTALNTGNRAQNDAILTSLIGSSTDAAIGMGAITNAGFFKDIQSTAHASTNTTSEQSSANATMNIANNMAIGGRIAKANNPYEKQMRFARMLKNSLFAALPRRAAPMHAMTTTAMPPMTTAYGQMSLAGQIS